MYPSVHHCVNIFVCVVVSHSPPGIQVMNTSAKIITNLNKVRKPEEELMALSMFHKEFDFENVSASVVFFFKKNFTHSNGAFAK